MIIEAKKNTMVRLAWQEQFSGFIFGGTFDLEMTFQQEYDESAPPPSLLEHTQAADSYLFFKYNEKFLMHQRNNYPEFTNILKTDYEPTILSILNQIINSDFPLFFKLNACSCTKITAYENGKKIAEITKN